MAHDKTALDTSPHTQAKEADVQAGVHTKNATTAPARSRRGRKRKYMTDSERQKAYRKKKQLGGRYIQIFVPASVQKKIKGNPSALVEAFDERHRLDSQISRLETLVNRLLDA